jgi:hypothetical protein
MPVQSLIQVRRDTAANWTSTNPTLASGEIGYETDTSLIKIGTGSTTWTNLTYGPNINISTTSSAAPLRVIQTIDGSSASTAQQLFISTQATTGGTNSATGGNITISTGAQNSGNFSTSIGGTITLSTSKSGNNSTAGGINLSSGGTFSIQSVSVGTLNNFNIGLTTPGTASFTSASVTGGLYGYTASFAGSTQVYNIYAVAGISTQSTYTNINGANTITLGLLTSVGGTNYGIVKTNYAMNFGTNNTIIGNNSFQNSGGIAYSYNTAYGASSFYVGSGNYNTTIGYNAGATLNGSANIVIGGYTGGTANNSLYIADGVGNLFISGSVSSGTSSVTIGNNTNSTITLNGTVSGGGMDLVYSGTFSTSSSFVLSNIFTSKYTNYKIIINFTTASQSSSQYSIPTIKLTSSGVESASGYYTFVSGVTNYSAAANYSSTAASGFYTIAAGISLLHNIYQPLIFELANPALAQSTGLYGLIAAAGNPGANYYVQGQGYHITAAAYDGFSFNSNSASVFYGGTIRVYGYHN